MFDRDRKLAHRDTFYENLGKELSRTNMRNLANGLRADNHPAILIEKLLEEAQKDKGGRAVIESIRTPAEAKLLRKFKNFRLLAVDADTKVSAKVPESIHVLTSRCPDRQH